MSWNAERIALLTELWADGQSCAQIAARLGGVTRNSVIGKVRRLGLSFRDPEMAGLRAARPLGMKRHRAHKGPPPSRLKAMKLGIWGNAPRQHERFVPRPEPIVIPPSERKPILVRKNGRLHANDALTEDTCRWWCGEVRSPDGGFCPRKKVLGVSYCEAHARRAYASPESQARECQRWIERKRQRVAA